MVLRSIPTRLGRKSTNSSTRTSPSNSKPASPRIMNDSTLKLKVTAVKGRDLAAMDRNGFSDPYLVVAFGEYRFTTEVQNKTLEPEWNDTFEMNLGGTNSTNMVCVCWDKDRFGKDYMGEFNVSVNDLFANGNVTEERWFPLRSTRKKTKCSGEILLQFTLEDTVAAVASDAPAEEQTAKKWQAWLSNVKGATPSSDDGTSDDPQTGERLDDDEDDDESENSDELAEQLEEAGVSGVSHGKATGEKKKSKRGLKKKKSHKPFELFSASDVVGVVFLEVGSVTDLPPEKNMTRTGFDMDPFVVVSLGKKVYRTKHIRHNLNPVYDEKMVFQVLRHEQNYSINFTVIDRDKLSGNDYVGEASFNLQEIVATQPSPNPETGLYNLPAPSREDLTSGTGSGSKSRFRIPLSRSASGSNLAKKPNRVNSAKSSSNASLAPEAELDSQQVTQQPAPNKVMPVSDSMDHDLKPFDLPLNLKNKDRWETKHSPEVHVKAKYVPYPALRQQFWRVMLTQYDADDSGEISRVELTTMLDTLGSTLSAKTIDSFFHRYMEEGETIDNKELTFDQAIICLEEKLNAAADSHFIPSLRAHLPKLHLPGMANEDDSAAKTNAIEKTDDGPAPGSTATTSAETLADNTITVPKLGEPGLEGSQLDDELAESDDRTTEHVIQINECPLCHQPRLDKRSEVDIVTHLATCASQDWRSVDRLVMGGFVTASQAQRKWYSKVITKISYGGYKLGANSANILVQDRMTGQIQEERMSVYVRLGIRLLYKGMASSNMENKKIRKLLESLSVKQGKKYDNPASAREIRGFIEFHQLNLNEVLLPLDEFKTFNEFFYRALKPEARPCSSPENPKIIVSPADCRSVVFNQVSDATNIWIKGREFTIKRLLGDAYPEDAERFANGGLGIFRLAPQDYHRFHMPVDGIMGEPKLIKGEYYTVNPMAIRSALDVYGENVRVLVPIDTEEFGRVMVICVGAMMVGSTVITAKAGSHVKRADELGYFKFGGSTLVVLFESGRMKWDEDLITNSKSALETLVRVGMAVGHSPDTVSPPQRKENVTAEDMADARRRIEGSLAPQK